MIRKILVLAAVCFGSILGFGSADARAQYPVGCGYSLYGSISRGVPPYFSLFPPVYYSVPVPRTYGYSPFAYPAGTPTPEIQVAPAQTSLMINPYVPRATAAPTADQTTGGPLTLINPFVAKAALELAGQ